MNDLINILVARAQAATALYNLRKMDLDDEESVMAHRDAVRAWFLVDHFCESLLIDNKGYADAVKRVEDRFELWKFDRHHDDPAGTR